MTLLFVDGFDHYATADITKKWTTVNGAATSIGASSGRRGGGGLGGSYAAQSGYVAKTIANEASFVIGFALSITVLPPSTCVLASFFDGATQQCSLVLNSNGTLSVVRGSSTALTDGTSAVAISTSAWHFVEWKVTIADSISASSCVVRLNGASIVTVAAAQDTKASANAYANSIRVGPQTSISAQLWIDDFYLCNQSGATNNNFLGDCRIDTLYPSADGTYSAFTPSTGTTHYTLVDETTPNTTDYNDGAAVNDRDSYAFGNLAALTSQTVYGVQVNAAILKDDAGAKSAATFARSVSTNTDGASAVLGTSQSYVSQVFEQDPNAAAAWTESTVNAAEFGVVVTA